MKYDITTKEAIKTIAEDVAHYILKLDIEDVEFIDKEFLYVEKREADVVVRCKIDKEPAILHLEIQNSFDKTMPLRMLRYYVNIKNEYPELFIHQYVLYTANDRTMPPNTLKDIRLDYSYTAIDIKTIDCEELIRLDTPDALILSILCDFKGRDAKELLIFISERLEALTADDTNKHRKYIQMLEIMVKNRKLNNTLEEVKEMLRMRMEELPSYEIGMKAGMEKGIEKGIEKGMEKGRFDSALLMLDFGIPPEKIAEKLNISLELLMEKMNEKK